MFKRLVRHGNKSLLIHSLSLVHLSTWILTFIFMPLWHFKMLNTLLKVMYNVHVVPNDYSNISMIGINFSTEWNVKLKFAKIFLLHVFSIAHTLQCKIKITQTFNPLGAAGPYRDFNYYLQETPRVPLRTMKHPATVENDFFVSWTSNAQR